MTLGVDFTSRDFFRDPLTALERLRAARRVVEVRLPMIGRVWMASLYCRHVGVLQNHWFLRMCGSFSSTECGQIPSASKPVISGIDTLSICISST